ncbi:MAG: aminotransferase class I/II-fold pyridoxal phosphate-dependent enzyme [Clostridia bacterium]|jgi:lysine decarboxylase|nr:aminotransferase class I/II-fold pyridoxal phosphate-dependent enzyme [Clostridia bacterium]
MNDKDIPILKALRDYSNEDIAYFHTPGHKGGNAFRKIGFEPFDKDLLSLDVTEVPGVDNLHCPETSIKEAQELAAQAFGAKHTFFLVNGTTGGIYSMILAATNPGDKIIIPRNCHKSVIGAVILARLQPIYISPELDTILSIASGISPTAVKKAIIEHPDAKVVVITSPTYYGVCSDLEQISKLAHDNKMLLLVDEAHGAHFGFHSDLPKTALQCGADMVAQSTHKTLPSMTQSSMMHVKSDKVNIDKLKFFLQLTQSTSPSHILLASLDTARYIMQQKGEELLKDIADECNCLRDEVNNTSDLYCLSKTDIGRDGIFDIDNTRITINFSKLGLSGTAVDEILRSKFKLQVEMSDLYNIVAICTVGDNAESVKRLSKAIRTIAKEQGIGLNQIESPSLGAIIAMPSMILEPWEAVYQSKEDVPIDNCIGRICGEMIVPYPPGIPIIMPGEIISKDVIDYALDCSRKGIKMNGMKDASLKYISVIK